MARRRTSRLAIVGGVLMAVSLLAAALAMGVDDAGVWTLGTLAALSFLLSLLHSTWAFVPAFFWLVMGMPAMQAIATWLRFREWRGLTAFLLIAWLLVHVWGGLCVILSSIHRRHAHPQTDVSAFE